MILTLLSQSGIRIPLTPFLLFVVLALLFAGWALFSWIVRYHWKNYGTGELEVIKMSLIYFVGSGILLALMALSAFFYNFSSL